MNKILKIALMLIFMGNVVAASAGVPITKVDRIEPTDEIFMSMAVDAARSSIAKKGAPSGAVVILNNAFNATGIPSAKASAEENAIATSRGDLANAVIYTVNEPTSAAYLVICTSGVGKVVFANAKDAVIAAGKATAADYEEVQLPEGVTATPMVVIDFPEAAALLK